MWQGEERRRYYRVDDRVALRYMRLSDGGSVAGELSDLSLRSRLADLELMLDQALAKLAVAAPEVLEVADLLNRKLDLALEGAGLGLDGERPATLVTRDVSLSGSGFAFAVGETLAVGEMVLVDLLFHPERRTIRALTRVVASDGPDAGYLRLDIERITEADQELLMSHILRLQSARLRQRDGASQSEPDE
ncbi:PilZ domain-containing protein [Marinobacter halodurans]|uniref:PilZ domain-containing protein n=1 Tax=Marinobacter halodurans TaxID=2528979 RepID=A0ABY1ZL87_9GAMM|nr:PilZ domain-containing protein [Marinobacter halodurans]TBW56236.1 PilZ domain-containing protein [Marinobacter halodurans]